MIAGILMLGVFHSDINNIEPAIAHANQSIISQEEAERIALEAVSGTIIHTELDSDDGITYFEVHIQTATYIAEVYINAHTGIVIEIDFEDDNDDILRNQQHSNANVENSSSENNEPQNNNTTPTQQTINNGMISMQEAEEIALEIAPGRVISTDFDDNIFSIHILEGVRIREIYIHAQTGNIMNIDTYNIALIGGGVLLIALPTLWGIRKIYKKQKENK